MPAAAMVSPTWQRMVQGPVPAPVVVQRQAHPHGLADHAENGGVSAVAAHRQGLRRGLVPRLMS